MCCAWHHFTLNNHVLFTCCLFYRVLDSTSLESVAEQLIAAGAANVTTNVSTCVSSDTDITPYTAVLKLPLYQVFVSYTCPLWYQSMFTAVAANLQYMLIQYLLCWHKASAGREVYRIATLAQENNYDCIRAEPTCRTLYHRGLCTCINVVISEWTFQRHKALIHVSTCMV